MAAAVRARLAEAGLTSRTDRLGNVIATLPGDPAAPSVMGEQSRICRGSATITEESTCSTVTGKGNCPWGFFAPLAWFFAATMFALGIVLDTGELRETVRHPGRIGLGVLTQYTVMPLLGFTVAMLVPLPPEIAVGFIIVACAPGAMASNVIVYLAGGAVAFSVAMTTVATFLSPLLTPALVELLGKVFLEIPFWPMMQTILLTVVVPLAAGDDRGQQSRP